MYMRDYEADDARENEAVPEPTIPAGYAGHIFDRPDPPPEEKGCESAPPPPPHRPPPGKRKEPFLPKVRCYLDKWTERCPIDPQWLILAVGVWLLCGDDNDDDLWIILLLLWFVK